MKTFSILHYLYLVFAALFLFDAIEKWNSVGYDAYISLFFSVLALAMFFFRKKFKKRFQDRGKL